MSAGVLWWKCTSSVWLFQRSVIYINSILAVIYVNNLRTLYKTLTYIKSILAVIYLTKLQNLINRDVCKL